MKTLTQYAKDNGFEYVRVSREDREDGIGVVVGDNYVKNRVWYTRQQMAGELGVEIVRKTVRVADANEYVRKAKAAGLKAFEITNQIRHSDGIYTLNVHYIK
jgi:hypothetical protein